jgi:hypothetical protein
VRWNIRRMKLTIERAGIMIAPTQTASNSASVEEKTDVKKGVG